MSRRWRTDPALWARPSALERGWLDGNPAAQSIAEEFPVRHFLYTLLGFWCDVLPRPESTPEEAADEIRACAWWYGQATMADAVRAARAQFPPDLHPHLASEYVRGVVNHVDGWLEHLAQLSPRATVQAWIIAKDMANPWSKSLVLALEADGARWEALRAWYRPGFNTPRPPTSPPGPGWRDYLDGLKEAGRVTWSTLTYVADYWHGRATGTAVAAPAADTLLDVGYVNRLGDEFNRVSLPLAAESAASIVDAAVGLGDLELRWKAPNPYSPTKLGDTYLAGLRQWSADIGSASLYLDRFNPASNPGAIRGIAGPVGDELESMWLQALALAGTMYAVGGGFANLFRGTVPAKATAVQAAAALAANKAAVAAGVTAVATQDPRTGAWIVTMSGRAAGGAARALAAPFKWLLEWWRFRRGAVVEWRTVADMTTEGMSKIQGTVRANRIAADLEIVGQIQPAIQTLANQVFTGGGAAAQAAVPTIINVGAQAPGIPMAVPTAGAAGALAGTGYLVAQTGAWSKLKSLLGWGAVGTAVVGATTHSAFILEEAAQTNGFAANVAQRLGNREDQAEAVRRINGVVEAVKGPALWIPGYNLFTAYREFFEAAKFQADTYGRSMTDAQQFTRAPNRAAPFPAGGSGRPARAPTREEQTWRGTRERADREGALVEEFASYFREGSALTWSDEGYTWEGRAKTAANRTPIVNTGPALKVWTLTDGRQIVRLPKTHALFTQIKDRFRRIKRAGGTFLPGSEQNTRDLGMWLVPAGKGALLAEVLLNIDLDKPAALAAAELEVVDLVAGPCGPGEPEPVGPTIDPPPAPPEIRTVAPAPPPAPPAPAPTFTPAPVVTMGPRALTPAEIQARAIAEKGMQ